MPFSFSSALLLITNVLYIMSLLLLLLLLHQANAQLGAFGNRISLTNPDVALSYCTVRGVEYSLSTGSTATQRYKVMAFFGVPYAAPPIGDDRFRVNTNLICASMCVYLMFNLFCN